MSPDRTLSFTTHFDLAAGAVDRSGKVIRGVSVITGNLVAKGHGLQVDETTLRQIQLCGSKHGQVPVKVNHKTGAEAVCGFLTAFRRDGDKLRADWHLLNSHPQTEQILETVERMPRGVGLSVSFISPPKEKGEPGKARCEELVSVDYVVTPAANPDGMFGASPVDTPGTGTAMTPEQIQQLLEGQNAILKRLDAQDQTIQALQEQIESSGQEEPPTAEEVAHHEATTGESFGNEQLAELGLTRAEVNSALAALSEGDDGDNGEGDDGEGAGEGEGEPAAAPAGVAAGFKAVNKAINLIQNFNARLDSLTEMQERQAFEADFNDIVTGFQTLQAENEALRTQLTANTNPAVQFSYGGFDPKTTDLSAESYEGAVELKARELATSNPSWTPAKVRGQAHLFVTRTEPALKRAYLQRKGIEKPTTL